MGRLIPREVSYYCHTVWNVIDLSKYTIDTYDRLGSSVQYEIQQILVENTGIPEEKKRRAMSADKSDYQHAVILDNLNKRKREKQAQGNSKGTLSNKRELSFLNCLKSFQNKIEQRPYYVCVICNRSFYKKLVRTLKSNENNSAIYLAINVFAASYDIKNKSV